MREKPRNPERLRHIHHAVIKVNEFLRDKERRELVDDSLLFYAVVKNIEIVGEAAYMLTPEFKESHPATPWKQIEGMRRYLVHGYYHVDLSEVWNVAVRDLKILDRQIIEYLKEFGITVHDDSNPI